MSNEEDIDEILNSITASEEVEEDKELVVQEDKDLVDASVSSELEQELIKQTLDDREQADQIFNLFFPDLGMGQDRTTASKEAITKALELKIMASRNIIDLLKLRKEANSKVGVFVNTIPSKKAGIDIRNIADAVD